MICVEDGVGSSRSGSEDALEVEDGEAAEPAHLDREARGSTTPSMAAAMIGSSKRWPQSSQDTSTSFGLMVTVPGTSAMSSNPYATRAFRPRPTHMPMRLALPRSVAARLARM